MFIVIRAKLGDATSMELAVKAAEDVRLTKSTEELIERRWEAIARVGQNSITNPRLEIRSFEPRRGAALFISQLTMSAGKHVIRAEERNTDVEAAVSASLDKALNQVRSYIGKRQSLRLRGQVSRDELRQDVAAESRALGEAVEATGHDDMDSPSIVRTKRFEMKPMTPEEAAEQMELLGHSFYFFNNAETGAHSVLYKRQDGDLGILLPE
jgi:putative sigma-54 modulation protein